MAADQDDVTRIRRYVRDERRAALLYRRLADTAGSEQAVVLRRLAASEESHARHWERLLGQLGVSVDEGPVRLHPRGHLALALGRRFGLIGAMPVLERHEGREVAEYSEEPHAPPSMVADEHHHTSVVRGLVPAWRGQVAGTLRAGVFGISDGIVSNLALVIGVLGSGASSGAVVAAGIAGLVAGALSMAVGEYVSVASQREVLQAGGEGADDEGARPLAAAVASLVTFAVGAFVPLLPFLLATGGAAAVAALAATGALLYGVGASLALLTMRSPLRSGLRQLSLGWGAAGLTYLVGLVLGAGGVV